MKALSCFLVPASLFLLGAVRLSAAPVIVHEWGTFTSFQDGDGKAIGGINVDDEPVPYFVSSVAVGVAPQYGPPQLRRCNLGLPPYADDKAWISGDPQVTMRLETPVIYLYPPKGEVLSSVPPLNVHVDFHGGVLSQFYPHADFAGLPLRNFPQNPELNGKMPYIDEKTGITETTTTSLDWKGVQLGSNENPVKTDDKVWTTPREVSAPLLQVKFSGFDFNDPTKTFLQAEHFLFYRGVGHLDSPLYLTRDAFNQGAVDHLYVWPSWLNRTTHAVTPLGGIALDASYAQGWLVDVHADGTCAFRSVPAFEEGVVKRVHPLTGFSSKFDENDFRPDNLAQLKASMQAALQKEGLYADEASAMLRTWELSYFKSPGLRFFYIAPRAWVDSVLPLKITGAPTEITRVMIGRIELIDDAQKAALARLSAGPCPNLAAVKQAAYSALRKSTMSKEDVDAFYSGARPLTELGIPIPPLVRDYLSLGRFRDALIVHENQQHPSPALAQFIVENKLKPDKATQ